MTADERVEAIRERLEAATPGPWVAFRPIEHDNACVFYEPEGTLVASIFPYTDDEGRDRSDADAELIAHAPEDIDYLLERLRQAQLDIEFYRNHYEEGIPLANCYCDDCMACRSDGERQEMYEALDGMKAETEVTP